jgi:hypothetical protein
MIDTKYAYRIFIWKSLGNVYLKDLMQENNVYFCKEDGEVGRST